MPYRDAVRQTSRASEERLDDSRELFLKPVFCVLRGAGGSQFRARVIITGMISRMI